MKATIDVSVDLPGEGYLPRQYVPDMRLKIDLYRRIARLADEASIDDLRAELIDRCPLPAGRTDAISTRLRKARMLGELRSRLEHQYLVLGMLAEEDRAASGVMAQGGAGGRSPLGLRDVSAELPDPERFCGG